MSHSWLPTNGVTRRLVNVVIAALLAFATLAVIPGGISPADATTNHEFEYVLVFQNGQVRSGITTDGTGNTIEVPDTGGESVGTPDAYMLVHASCSDDFNLDKLPSDPLYGYSSSGGQPTLNVDTAWRVADYAFRRTGSNGGQCGNLDLFDAHLTIDKKTNDSDHLGNVLAGTPLTWTYLVTNTGSVALTNVTVTDNKLPDSDITCPSTTLGIGASMTCEATGTAQPGAYANIGTADSEETPPAIDDSSYFGQVPGLTIEKSTNGEDADAAPGPSITKGAVVTWEYVVTNSGDVDLTGVIVTDNILGDVCSIGNLDVGESETCELSGTAALGQYANVGTATDNNGDGASVSATDPSHYLGVAGPVPGVSIEKSTNGEDADSAPGPSITVGDAVTWTYRVTNAGTLDLTGVIVTDDILGDVCSIGDLDVGESETCEMSGTAALGQYANVGTATDNNGDGSSVTATDPSHYLGVAAPVPSISIDKSTNGEDADAAPGASITVGEAVTWTYKVTNTGEVDLTGVIVTDDILGDVCLIGELAIGESDTCELTGVATAGQYANVGTVVDNHGDGSTVSATDPSHYFGQEIAASATIGDTVWNDENKNGIQDNGEKGIAGAKVKLTLPDATTLEAVTNANGLYLFAGLEAGTYTAAIIMSSIPAPADGENTLTTSGSFTIQLADDESYLDADFGIASELPKTGISTDILTLIALALLGAGGVALLATRKRNDIPESDVAA